MPYGGAGFVPVLTNEPKTNQAFNEVPDGVRVAFTLSDDFVNDGSLNPMVYWNGQRLSEVNGDFVASESGGAGTGYDTITFVCAPKTDTELMIDYFVE